MVALIVLFLAAVVVGQLVDRHAIDLPIHAPDYDSRGPQSSGSPSSASRSRSTTARRSASTSSTTGCPNAARQIMAIVSDIVTLAMSGWIAFKGWAVALVGAGQYLLGTPFTAAPPTPGCSSARS